MCRASLELRLPVRPGEPPRSYWSHVEGLSCLEDMGRSGDQWAGERSNRILLEECAFARRKRRQDEDVSARGSNDGRNMTVALIDGPKNSHFSTGPDPQALDRVFSVVFGLLFFLRLLPRFVRDLSPPPGNDPRQADRQSIIPSTNRRRGK